MSSIASTSSLHSSRCICSAPGRASAKVLSPSVKGHLLRPWGVFCLTDSPVCCSGEVNLIWTLAVLLFSVSCLCKLDIFWFLTVGQTKQESWRWHFILWEKVLGSILTVCVLRLSVPFLWMRYLKKEVKGHSPCVLPFLNNLCSSLIMATFLHKCLTR